MGGEQTEADAKYDRGEGEHVRSNTKTGENGSDRGEEELANALPGNQDSLLFLAVNAVDFASELLHGDPLPPLIMS